MLEVSVSKDGLDPEWDRFLETKPDGCYQQSSLWAELKARFGWKPLRLVVKRQGEIVGGTQALLRPLTLFGSVGYVSKGPVVASDDPVLLEFLLDQLDHAAKTEHILFLKIQPAYGAERVAQCLLQRGAIPSETSVVPVAAPRTDISPEPEAILARMHYKTRYNIRRAERKGMSVRIGTEADMHTFHRLVKVHSEQQGYSPSPDNYRYDLWSTFSTRGRACLLVAEYEGEILSATVILAFGDAVFSLYLVDSGQHRDLNPQSLLQWKAMLWGKEQGCAWYDFGGLNMSTVKTIMSDESLPDTRAGSLARYKMSFGSQLVFRPRACDVSFVWPRRLTGRMAPVLMDMNMRPLLRSLIGGSIYGDFRSRPESRPGSQ